MAGQLTQGVGKCGNDRKYVKQQHSRDQPDTDKATGQEKGFHRGKNRPDGRRLHEVLLKAVKKCLPDRDIFILMEFQRRVIHGRGRGPDRHDGETRHKPEDI